MPSHGIPAIYRCIHPLAAEGRGDEERVPVSTADEHFSLMYVSFFGVLVLVSVEYSMCVSS